MKVVTVTSICFGFVICLGPYYIFAVARILGVPFLRNNTVCDVSYHVSLVLIQVRLLYISSTFHNGTSIELFILVFSCVKCNFVFIPRFKISIRTLPTDVENKSSFNQQVLKYFNNLHDTES